MTRTATLHPRGGADGWAPSSPCTTDCLPVEGPTVGRARTAIRLARTAAVVLVTVLGVLLLSGRLRDRWVRACSRAVLRAAGARLRIIGADEYVRRGSGVLVVANHMSWIDVLALDTVTPVRMLAKREVRDWPVIGWIAERTGALFVDRAGLHALPATVEATARVLRAGGVVGVFPEGTTWCGQAAGTFRRAAFQAAIDADVPVRPVAIGFRLPDGTPARGAAFVGDQSLVGSLLRVVRIPGLVCEVTVLPAIRPGGDRRELARRAGEAVGWVTGVGHGAAPSTPPVALPDREPAVAA